MALTAVKGLSRAALIRALVAEVDHSGLDRLGLRAVARRAGVTAPALYWHFRAKDDLCDAALEAIGQHLQTRVAAVARRARPARRLHAVLQVMTDYGMQHPRRFDALCRPPARQRTGPLQGPAPGADMHNRLEAQVTEAMRTGRLRRADPGAVTLTIIALLQGLALLRCQGRFATIAAARRAARAAMARLLQGIAT